jgi:hypothetical protein
MTAVAAQGRARGWSGPGRPSTRAMTTAVSPGVGDHSNPSYRAYDVADHVPPGHPTRGLRRCGRALFGTRLSDLPRGCSVTSQATPADQNMVACGRSDVGPGIPRFDLQCPVLQNVGDDSRAA